MATNITNYGWAYTHPTLGIGLTRGPENSLTFQKSATADIDANGMGQASGSANLTYNNTTSVLTLAGSVDITENDGTLAPLKVRQDGTGDIVQILDGATEVFTILNGGNVGIGYSDAAVDKKLKVNGTGYFHSDLTVNGNLIVNGTSTTINSTVTTIEDPVIMLGDSADDIASDDNLDRGIKFQYYDGSKKFGFFGYDESTARFTFIPVAAEGSANVFTGTRGEIEVGGIRISDDGSTFGIQIGVTADGEINTAVGDLTLDSAGGTVIVDDNLQVNGASITMGSAEISEAELEILDGASVTTAELNIMDGDTAATITDLAPADRVVVNDDGTMVQVAMSDFETFMETNLDTLANVTTVGALNAGSITSGFGSIDVGSSAITTTGTVSGGVLAGALSTAAQPSVTTVGALNAGSITSGFGSIDVGSSEITTTGAVATGALTVTGDLTVDTNVLYVDSTGDKVGIGTTQPTNQLTIASTSNCIMHLAADADNHASIDLTEQAGSSLGEFGTADVNGFRVAYQPSPGGSIEDYFALRSCDGTSVTTRMVVERTTGKVGIGTTTPDTLLTVTGDAKFFDDTNDTVLFLANGNTLASPTHHRIMRLTTTGLLQFRDQIDSRVDMTIDGDGDVGIGTTTPSTKLDVNGTVTATAFTGNLTGNVTGNASTATSATSATTAGTVTTAAQTAITSVGTLTALTVAGDLTVDTDTLYVDSVDNRVGIGTTSPGRTLSVDGTSGFNGTIYLGGNAPAAGGGNAQIQLDYNGVDGDILFSPWNGSAWGENLFLEAATGRVGIGTTTPDQKLEVNGAIHISGEITTPSAPSDDDGGILYTKTDGRLYWRSYEQAETEITQNTRKTITAYESTSTDQTLSITEEMDFITIKTIANGNQNHGGITITLPSAKTTGTAGKTYQLKEIGANVGSGTDKQSISINVVTGGGNIDGTGGYSIDSNNAAVGIFSDGSDWWVF